MLTKPKATIEDYKKLPEGAKYELIDGEIIEREVPNMPGPKIKHQEISATIIRIIGNAIVEKKHGIVFHAPTDVYFDEENAFQPDILFISSNRVNELKKEDAIYGVPDLIIEITSPSTAYYDLKKKFGIYEKFGVREYWIIDPQDNEVVGYLLQNNKFKEFFRDTGKLISKILDCHIEF